MSKKLYSKKIKYTIEKNEKDQTLVILKDHKIGKGSMKTL